MSWQLHRAGYAWVFAHGARQWLARNLLNSSDHFAHRPALSATRAAIGGETMEEAIQSSVRKNTAPRVTYPALVAARDVDICIVGAGVVGNPTANMLLREGK